MKTYRVTPSRHTMNHTPFRVEADRVWLGGTDDWVIFYKKLGRFKGEATVFAVRSEYVESVDPGV